MVKDLVDDSLARCFMEGFEGALVLTLERGIAVCSISLPRILYCRRVSGLPGSRSKGIAEVLRYLALGSVDGVTPPVVLV